MEFGYKFLTIKAKYKFVLTIVDSYFRTAIGINSNVVTIFKFVYNNKLL